MQDQQISPVPARRAGMIRRGAPLLALGGLVSALAFAPAPGGAAEGGSAAPAAKPKAPESKSIFNGKDLTGWKIYGTEIWKVENGELICESGPDKHYGYLGTEKEYKNFDVSVDFKQEANGNSGLFFRSRIDGVKIAGWQSEIAPPGSNSGRIYESYGRGWITPEVTPEQNAALKFGEWNTMRVRVEGDHVQTWLNGTPIADFKDAKIGAATGIIALQIHDGGGIKVRWKNLRVQEL